MNVRQRLLAFMGPWAGALSLSLLARTLSIRREEARRAGDPAYLVARADRIRAELGWQPRYDDLQAIVSHSLAWEHKLLKDPWK